MKRRRFSSLLGGTALASLVGVPAHAEPPAGCGVPSMREGGWAVSSVDHDKLVDRPGLCDATDRLVASGANIHSVLVARGGQLVFERYFKGLDEIPDDIFGRRVANVAFDADTLHDVKSVSKSVASLAVGIAIDQGLIRSVNDPIFSFFPELADLRTPEKDRILLLHALDMTMGLEWVEATPATGDLANDEARMHMAADQCRYVLSLALTAPAGQEFHYSTGSLALVSAVGGTWQARARTGRLTARSASSCWCWRGFFSPPSRCSSARRSTPSSSADAPRHHGRRRQACRRPGRDRRRHAGRPRVVAAGSWVSTR